MKYIVYKTFFLWGIILSSSLSSMDKEFESPTEFNEEQLLPICQQPRSLKFFASKQVAQNCASYFHSINGDTIDELSEPLATIHDDLKSLLAHQLLVAAAKKGYIFDFKFSKKNFSNSRFGKNKTNMIQTVHPEYYGRWHSHSPNKEFLAATLPGGKIKVFSYGNKAIKPFCSFDEEKKHSDGKPVCYTYIQFLDETTFLTFDQYSPDNVITFWQLDKKNKEIKKLKEKTLHNKKLFIDCTCREFCYIQDYEKGSIWTINNDTSFYKILTLEYNEIVHAFTTYHKKLTIMHGFFLESDFHFISNDHGRLFLQKKVSGKLSTDSKLKELIVRYNLTRKMITGFDNDIIICSLYCTDLRCKREHDKDVAIDAHSGTIININNAECNSNNFELPPLEAIFASIAFSNSFHDAELLKNLQDSTSIQLLDENYKKHVLDKISSKINEFNNFKEHDKQDTEHEIARQFQRAFCKEEPSLT